MKPEYEAIIKDLQEMIAEHWSDEEKNYFYLTGIGNDDKLISYHDNLGRFIRNKYNLWSIKWEPEIRDGTDYSPYHPDAISMTLIEELWKRGLQIEASE